ncbi:MAG: methyltransferase domain-containing protein [Oscillospiraceae bacterium]|jgi:SAM-dependent methyltransferase|nr:methyltransferase domain-containing protein [Oscillospiraceae bacterium]
MKERTNGFDTSTELTYFRNLWETRRQSPTPHSPDIWDERAEEWIGDLGADGAGKRGMRERVDATALYLRGRGLLGKNDAAVDVGCGPGLFVAEFAKTAKYAVGIDYSARFIEYAEKYAAEHGIDNASYRREDFFAFDVKQAGLEGAFDLVFTSITPAASGEGCLEKLIAMSRAWCCNASFVHASDSLAERVSRDVFGEEYRSRFDGAGFYALLNLLWFEGFYPETYYYDDPRVEIITPTEKSAVKAAANCGHDSPEDVQKVLKYLEKLGEIERRSKFRYGSVLWDVRVKDRR